MTTSTVVQARFQLRADTAANWTSVNPILLANEFGLETDTKKLKVGNGSTAWSSLAYFPSIVSGGTVLGNLEIGTTGTLTFEGSTADGFETALAVVNPTADRTITLPNQTGTVIVSGNASIVDADISATAEIAVSKLADGAARQLLQTDAAGTGVEWTSNVDIPGTLDVTSTATFDGNVTIAGGLTVNGTTTNINTQNLVVEDKNVILGDVATPTDVTADGGGITLKGTTDKTINWVDATDAWTLSEHVNIASGKEYRINGTKVLDGTSLGSGVTGSSLTSVGTIGTGVWQGTAINKSYLDSTLVSTGDTGTVTSTMIADGTIVNADINASAAIDKTKISGTAITAADSGTVTSTMIADGTIVNADVNASAAIAGTKISPDFGSQNTTTTGTSTAASFIPSSSTAPTNGVYLPAANSVGISTNGTERLFVSSSGSVGINQGNPAARLDVNGNSRVSGGGLRVDGYFSDGVSPYNLSIGTTGNIGYLQAVNVGALSDLSIDGSPIIFRTGSYAERARIDSSGRLLVGTSSANTNYYISSTATTPQIQLKGLTSSTAAMVIHNDTGFPSAAAPARLHLVTGGQGTGGTGTTNLALNDIAGAVHFSGLVGDGSTLSRHYNITQVRASVDGTPSFTSTPGRVEFLTTPSGSTNPTDAFRITADKVVLYEQPTPTSKSAAATLTVDELKTGIIQYTGAAATLTLPTGTLTQGGFNDPWTNMAFEWSVINTGSGTCTIGAGTAHTIVGAATITAGASGRFASRRTASNTFVSYRIA